MQLFIPDDAEIFNIDYLWKADRITLSERMPLWDVETVEFLLMEGADIHADDDFVIRQASMMGLDNIVQVLLDDGANVEIAAHIGEPLTVASRCGHVEVVKLLLKAGAVVNKVDYHGQCEALNYACEAGHVQVVELLLKAGAKIQGYALRQACFNGHIDVVRLLIKRGADGLEENSRIKRTRPAPRLAGNFEWIGGGMIHGLPGRNARFFAKAGGHTEIVELLERHFDFPEYD